MSSRKRKRGCSEVYTPEKHAKVATSAIENRVMSASRESAIENRVMSPSRESAIENRVMSASRERMFKQLHLAKPPSELVSTGLV